MPNYHLCYTSHDEVMFRNAADMDVAFNSLCSALYKTDSACYAETFLTDHHHGCYRTRCPGELIRTARESYTKQFNHKYLRDGPLGERGFFLQEISGERHFLAALSYVLKNPPHHGVADTPFAYPYSSANAFFRTSLGKAEVPDMLPPGQIPQFLPRRAAFDPSWKMLPSGVFWRPSVLDVAAVEAAYGSYQAFNYYLGRKSGDDWKKEQDRDQNGAAPLTLESFEAPVLVRADVSLPDLLRNEKSRYRTAAITDLELCGIIDTQIIPRIGKKSVYQLSLNEKIAIANDLYTRYPAGKAQLKRCLVL